MEQWVCPSSHSILLKIVGFQIVWKCFVAEVKLAGGPGGLQPFLILGVQTTPFQPGGQIMPTTLLLAPPRLKTPLCWQHIFIGFTSKNNYYANCKETEMVYMNFLFWWMMNFSWAQNGILIFLSLLHQSTNAPICPQRRQEFHIWVWNVRRGCHYDGCFCLTFYLNNSLTLLELLTQTIITPWWDSLGIFFRRKCAIKGPDWHLLNCTALIQLRSLNLLMNLHN